AGASGNIIKDGFNAMKGDKLGQAALGLTAAIAALGGTVAALKFMGPGNWTFFGSVFNVVLGVTAACIAWKVVSGLLQGDGKHTPPAPADAEVAIDVNRHNEDAVAYAANANDNIQAGPGATTPDHI